MFNLFNFPKKLRLLNKKDFNLVLKIGKKINISSLINIYINLNKFKYPRIGIIISKKKIKLAHNRNQIKRIIRESFRINKLKLPCIDLVFVLKNIISKEILKNILNELWYMKCIT